MNSKWDTGPRRAELPGFDVPLVSPALVDDPVAMAQLGVKPAKPEKTRRPRFGRKGPTAVRGVTWPPIEQTVTGSTIIVDGPPVGANDIRVPVISISRPVGEGFVSFFVPGVAQTKGSHRAFVVKGRAIMTNDNPKEKGWRATIAIVANEAMNGRGMLTGPVRLELTFFRPRPKAHLNSKGDVKPRYDAALPDTKPDWDKMGRSVGDALNGICYRDDAQITAGLVLKAWGPNGVQVLVRQDKRP